MPNTRTDLGLALLTAGRPREAIEHLSQALAGNPFDRRAHYVLQQCLEQQGKGAAARAQLERLKRVEATVTRLITIANRLMPNKPHEPALHHELGELLTQASRLLFDHSSSQHGHRALLDCRSTQHGFGSTACAAHLSEVPSGIRAATKYSQGARKNGVAK